MLRAGSVVVANNNDNNNTNNDNNNHNADSNNHSMHNSNRNGNSSNNSSNTSINDNSIHDRCAVGLRFLLTCVCGVFLHSAKGGAVETACSDLNGVIYYFTI